MRNLLIIITLFCFVGLKAFALPNCKGSVWTKQAPCFGSDTWDNGDRYVGDFKNGKLHGPWKQYLPGKKVLIERNFKDGERHGPERYYFLNGQIEYDMTFKDGEPFGIRKDYDFDGTLLSETFYDNGKKVKQKKGQE